MDSWWYGSSPASGTVSILGLDVVGEVEYLIGCYPLGTLILRETELCSAGATGIGGTIPFLTFGAGPYCNKIKRPVAWDVVQRGLDQRLAIVCSQQTSLLRTTVVTVSL